MTGAAAALAAAFGLAGSAPAAPPLGSAEEAQAGRPAERVSELLSRRPLEATQVTPGVHLVSGNSNAYLIATPGGHIVVDTGLGIQARATRALLRTAAPGTVRALVLTHAHPDHIEGAPLWREPGLQIIAHRLFRERNLDHARLVPFRNRRARVLWGDVMPDDPGGLGYPIITPDVVVDDRMAFEVGGQRFEVLSTPGGEGPDGVSVWLPDRAMLFCGDALGPTLGAFPNLFTLRGETLRPAAPMIETLERMIALEPEWLLPGHFEPLHGRDRIRAVLERTRDALRYVHDATVAGMNDGKDVWTLMREIRLPAHLAVSQQYGRVPWGVRAIWEYYTGWFRYESTTELFDVPPRAVYADVAGIAGVPALVARAREHLAADRPLEALHLTEMALAGAPGDAAARDTRRAALERILETRGRGNFQLEGWLRHALSR